MMIIYVLSRLNIFFGSAAFYSIFINLKREDSQATTFPAEPDLE